MFKILPAGSFLPATARIQGIDPRDQQSFVIQLHGLLTQLDQALEVDADTIAIRRIGTDFLCAIWNLREEEIQASGNYFHIPLNPEYELLLGILHPKDREEMIGRKSLEKAAFYNLILHALNYERKDFLKYLVLTNLYEWYFFETEQVLSIFETDPRLKISEASKHISIHEKYRIIAQLSQETNIMAVHIPFYGLSEALSTGEKEIFSRTALALKVFEWIKEEIPQPAMRKNTHKWMQELLYVLGWELKGSGNNPYVAGEKINEVLAYLQRRRQECLWGDFASKIQSLSPLSGTKSAFPLPNKEVLPFSGSFFFDKEGPALTRERYLNGLFEKADWKLQLTEHLSTQNPDAWEWGRILATLGRRKEDAPLPLRLDWMQNFIREALLLHFNNQLQQQYHDWDSLVHALKKLDPQKNLETLHRFRFCDPSCGNGQVLVAALHELLLAIQEFGALCDAKGESIKDAQISYESGRLFILNELGELQHLLHPHDSYSEALLMIHESLLRHKMAIIQYCLYGVEKSPWLATLAKNALFLELAIHAHPLIWKKLRVSTVLNLDHIIKCGNALLFTLPLEIAPRTESKEQLRVLDPRREKLERLKKQAGQSNKVLSLWGGTEAGEDTEMQIQELENQLAQEDGWSVPFEWHEEFPELWDAQGKLQGIDAVASMPSWVKAEDLKSYALWFRERYKSYDHNANSGIYTLEIGVRLLKQGGRFAFQIPAKWQTAQYAEGFRNWLQVVSEARLHEQYQEGREQLPAQTLLLNGYKKVANKR